MRRLAQAVFLATLLFGARAAADEGWIQPVQAHGFSLTGLPVATLGTQPLRLTDVAVGSCAIFGTGVNVATFRCGVEGTDFLSPSTGLLLASHAATSIVGRAGSGTGNAADISCPTPGTFLGNVSGTLACAAAAGVFTPDAPLVFSGSHLQLTLDGVTVGQSAGAVQRLALTFTGDATGTMAAGSASAALTLGANVVTVAKLQQFAGDSLVGVAGSSAANAAAVTATADNQVFQRLAGTVQAHTLDYGQLTGTPTALSFTGPLTLTGSTVSLAANGITGALFRQSAALSLVGNPGGSLANVQDIACSGDGQTFWDNAGTIGCALLPYSKLSGAPAGLPPTGSASGDLGGSFPGPLVLAAEFSGTRLTFGAAASGALLKVSGSSVIGATQGTDFVVTVRADGIATGTVQLASLSAANMVDGAIAWVDSVGDYFRLGQSAQTTTPTTVITASGKSGYQWTRLGIQNRANWPVPNWYIDPVGGNDENAGTTSGAPLKTNAEWTLRMVGGLLTGFPVVTFLSDVPDADSITIPTSGGGLVFAGSETILSTQTVTSAQARTPASNLANEITVAGFNWTPYLNTFVRIQGTSNYAAVIKVVGSGVARLGELWNTATSTQASSTGIGAGAVIEIVRPTKGPLNLTLAGRSTYAVEDLRFDGAGLVTVASGGGDPEFVRVIFGGTSLNLTATSGYGIDGGLCMSPSAVIAVGVSQGLAFTSTTLSFQNVGDVLANMKMRSSVFQGTAITLVVGLHVDADLGQFDIPVATAGISLPGTESTAEGAILAFNSGRHYGTGSASSWVWSVGSPTLVVYNSAFPPTNTAALGVQINGANMALSSLPYPYSPFHANGVVDLTGAPANGTCTNCTATIQNGVVTAYSSGTAGVAAPGSNGLMVWNGSSALGRTLVSGDSSLSFANPDGVAGNPDLRVNSVAASKLTGTLLAAQAPALTGPVTTTAGSFATSLNLGAGGITGALPLGDLATCSPGQVVGMVAGVQGCVTPTAGTVYTGTSPIVVSGSAISCPTCGTGTGSVSGVFGTAGQITVTPSTPNPTVSLVAKGAGAGAYAGNGIAGFSLDAFGGVTAVSAANYLTSTGTTPGTYNQFTDAASGLITGASNTSWTAIGNVMVSGGTAATPTGFGNFRFVSNALTVGDGSTSTAFDMIASPSFSAAMQFWKDATPTKAGSVGNGIPGGSTTNDLLFTTYDGTSWTERGRFVNGGSLQVAALSAGGIVKAIPISGALTLAASVDITNAISWPTGMLKGGGGGLTTGTAGSDYSAGTASLATGPLCNTNGTGALSACTPTASAAAITWPASPRVLISGGISATPVGDSTFTFDTSLHALTVHNLNASNINLAFTGSTLAGFDPSGNLTTITTGSGLTFNPGTETLSADAAPSETHYYANNFDGLTTNSWLVPGKTTPEQQSASAPPETRLPFQVAHVRLLIHNLSSAPSSACNTGFAVSQNGNVIAGSALNVTSTTTPNTFQDTGRISVSTSSTDSWGLQLSTVPSNQIGCTYIVYVTEFLYSD